MSKVELGVEVKFSYFTGYRTLVQDSKFHQCYFLVVAEGIIALGEQLILVVVS